jgi:hypothetical protein
MSNQPDEFPGIEPRKLREHDSELEWLLCLASRYQACQACLKPMVVRTMPPWRRALRWLGLPPKGIRQTAA